MENSSTPVPSKMKVQSRLRFELLLLGFVAISSSLSRADCTPPKKGIFGAFGGAEQENTKSTPCVPDAKDATKDRAVAEAKESECKDKKLAKIEFFKFCKTQIFVKRYEMGQISNAREIKAVELQDEEFCRCLAEKSHVEAFADDSKCQFKSRQYNHPFNLIRTLTDDEVRYDCNTVPSFLKN